MDDLAATDRAIINRRLVVLCCQRQLITFSYLTDNLLNKTAVTSGMRAHTTSFVMLLMSLKTEILVFSTVFMCLRPCNDGLLNMVTW